MKRILNLIQQLIDQEKQHLDLTMKHNKALQAHHLILVLIATWLLLQALTTIFLLSTLIK